MKSPLLIVGILLILALSTALIGPFFVDWTSYRGDFERFGRQLTGRQVEIAGDVSVRLVPLPRIRLGEVRVFEPGRSRPYLTADAVDIKLALPPLLRATVRVTAMALERPAMVVERAVDGSWSWAFAPSRASGLPVDPGNIVLDDLSVSDGIITLRDQRRGGSAELEAVEAQISAGALSGPFRVRGSARYGGEPLDISLSVGRWRADAPLGVGLRVKPEGPASLVYGFDGEIGGPQNQGLRGVLRVERGVSGEVSEGEPGGSAAPQPFLLRANASAIDDRLRLDDIEINLPDPANAANLVTGSAEVELAETVSVNATLEASRLSLDTFAGDPAAGPLPGPDRLLAVLDAFLSGIPDGLEVTVSLKTALLSVGSETIESFRGVVHADKDRLSVRELSGIAPGRTRANVTATYLADAETPQLSGDLVVEALNGTTFAAWAFPALEPFVERGPARTRLGLKGALDIAPGRVRLSDALFTVDEASGKLSMAYAGGERASWTVQLDADRVDLDRYAAAPAEDGGAQPAMEDGRWDAFTALLPEIDAAWLQRTDVTLDLSVDRLAYRGVEAADVAVDLALTDGNIDIRTLKIGRIGDASVEMSGLVRSLAGQPDGRVSATVSAEDPLAFLKLIGLVDSGRAATAPVWARRLGPLNLTASADSQPAGDGAIAATLRLDGTAGAATIAARGSFDGAPAAWREANVSGDVQLSSDSAEALLALFGVAPARRGGAEGAGAFNLEAQGRLADRLEVTVRSDLMGVETRIDAAARDRDGSVDYDATVALDAAAPAGFYRLLGAAPAAGGAKPPLSLKGRITGQGGQMDLDEWRGSIAGAAVGFDGSLDLAATPLQVEGRLDVEALSLPWLLATALTAPGGTVDVAESAREGTVWPARSFALSRFGVVGGSVEVAAGRLTLAGLLALDDASFTLALGDHGMAIEAAEGAIDGRRARFDLAVQARDSEIEVRGSVEARALPLAPYLRMASGQPAVQGSLGVSMAFEGRGRSPAGLVAGLAGEGRYRLGEGTLSGISPAAFSAAIADATTPGELDRMIRSLLQEGRMGFAGTSGDIRIENGLMHLDPVDVEGSGASGEVESFFDLGEGRTDISWRLGLANYPGIPPLELALSGPPGALTRSYDTTSLRSYLVVRVLEESMDRLEDLQREQERFLDHLTPDQSARSPSDDADPGPTTRQVEEGAQRQAEEEARRQAEEEARRQAEEEARRQAEEEARRQADEEARRQAEEEARRQAEEEARRQAEEEARRQAEEEARRQAEEEARRQAEEEARRQAEEEARRQAGEEARRQAEEEARRRAEEEEAAEPRSVIRPGIDSEEAVEEMPLPPPPEDDPDPIRTLIEEAPPAVSLDRFDDEETAQDEGPEVSPIDPLYRLPSSESGVSTERLDGFRR